MMFCPEKMWGRGGYFVSRHARRQTPTPTTKAKAGSTPSSDARYPVLEPRSRARATRKASSNILLALISKIHQFTRPGVAVVFSWASKPRGILLVLTTLGVKTRKIAQTRPARSMFCRPSPVDHCVRPGLAAGQTLLGGARVVADSAFCPEKIGVGNLSYRIRSQAAKLTIPLTSRDQSPWSPSPKTVTPATTPRKMAKATSKSSRIVTLCRLVRKMVSKVVGAAPASFQPQGLGVRCVALPCRTRRKIAQMLLGRRLLFGPQRPREHGFHPALTAGQIFSEVA